MENQTNIPDWKQRLSAELRRDKKKTAVLAILMVVGGVVGGRLLMGRLAPAPAAAEVPAMFSSSTPSAAGSNAGKITEDVARENKRNQYIQSIQCNAMRDLFTPNAEYYPEETPATTKVQVVPTTKESSELSRQAEERTVKAQAKALYLQSIMLSASPTAIINGKVVRKGDWISGFQVSEITANACMIQKNGFTLVLEMCSNEKSKKTDSGNDSAN